VFAAALTVIVLTVYAVAVVVRAVHRAWVEAGRPLEPWGGTA
jgi:uncharacterized membrane protein (DUF485 family)